MRTTAVMLTLMGLVMSSLAVFLAFAGKIDVAGRSAPMSGEVQPSLYITLESDPAMFLLIVGFLGLLGLFLFWGGWQQWRRSDQSK